MPGLPERGVGIMSRNIPPRPASIEVLLLIKRKMMSIYRGLRHISNRVRIQTLGITVSRKPHPHGADLPKTECTNSAHSFR